jgi:RNA polymerase sigma-70 factor (ECF subfamily)
MPGHDGAAAAERFEGLLDEYGQLLRRAIVHLCPKHLGLEFDDIEQEARLRLWRTVQAATELSHPASYVYRAAVSATFDAVRRLKARREEQLRIAADPGGGPLRAAGALPHPVAPGEDSPARRAERRAVLREIHEALDELPPDRRRAVSLHLRGFVPREIAELLRWSEPQARSLVYRGLEELRRRLRRRGIEHELGRRAAEPAL